MRTNKKLFAEQTSDNRTVKERLAKYVANWPLFLVIFGLCVGGGFLYAWHSTPKYMATTSFLIKSDGNSQTSNDLIEEALNGKGGVNLSNAMFIVGSSALMERVVKKENFNVSYYSIGKILNVDVYLDAPFRLIAKDSDENKQPVYLQLQQFTEEGGNGSIGEKDNGQSFSFQWNVPFLADGKTVVLSPTTWKKNEKVNFLVTWKPVTAVAAELSGSLSVTPFDVKTNAVELSLKTENLQKGKDILNAVFREFNLSDIEERNRIAENTVQFIDERLANISTELKKVEGGVEEYRRSRRLPNISEQSQQTLKNANDASETIKDFGVQQAVAGMILEYFQNPANSNKLVPSSLGLNDATLSSLISQYNEVQLKKEREAPLVAPNSTVLQDLNTQTANLRSSILESLNNLTRNLNFRERNFRQQNDQYNQFLAALPHNERVLQEINRKQGITQGLYLYLLQRREETAISNKASNVSHYMQTDLAKGYGPVEPNVRNWIVITALLGIFLSFGLIYLRDLFNDKVNNRRDVTRKLRLQFFGDISHVPKRKKSPITALTNNVIGEQFTAIRTNLSFVLRGKTAKTILVTSSSTGEGKSFVSLNLAAVCATPGKRVALLEFDVRKPELRNVLPNSEQGLTTYLSGESDDVSELAHVIGDIPGLHLYPAGPVPANPADLLIAENVSRLFEALKYQYDYIIVDSPPAGMVSDVFILGEFCDLVLYIIRQCVTSEKQLDFISDVESSNKLKNIRLLFNDVKTGGKYNYYGYGLESYKYPKSKNLKI